MSFAFGSLAALGIARAVAARRFTVRLLSIGASGLAVAMFAAISWLAGPMHDLALTWGVHGRWGDGVVGERGASAYLVTSQTLPLIVFGTLLALVTGLGAVVLRRAR